MSNCRPVAARYAAPTRNLQRGIALITGLLILMMLTLLAISMFQGTGLQQKIAGNTREKERAFEAAQNSLQYAEYWLTQGGPGTGLPCTNSIDIHSDADMRACVTMLATPSDPSTWPVTLNYTPLSMQVATGGGQTTDGDGNGDINYAKVPGLYIAYLGTTANSQQMLYSVTGAGYGGSSGTSSVVQSVFAVSKAVGDLGNE